MSGLESIPVRVEGGLQRDFRTDNLDPILRQIEQALADLAESGAETTIDLAAMPFSEQDEHDLYEALGRGEVSASMNAFGPTEIFETAYSGVWLVEHRNAEQRRLTLHIEITRMPSILMTPEGDVVDALSRLREDLQQAADSREEEAR